LKKDVVKKMEVEESIEVTAVESALESLKKMNLESYLSENGAALRNYLLDSNDDKASILTDPHDVPATCPSFSSASSSNTKPYRR
jgi:hypothetical protein